MAVKQWGSEKGIELLKNLSKLYLNLVWESTVLLSLCSGEYQPGYKQFGRQDLEKLFPPELQVCIQQSILNISPITLFLFLCLNIVEGN
jgi:hypothetical protein